MIKQEFDDIKEDEIKEKYSDLLKIGHLFAQAGKIAEAAGIQMVAVAEHKGAMTTDIEILKDPPDSDLMFVVGSAGMCFSSEGFKFDPVKFMRLMYARFEDDLKIARELSRYEAEGGTAH